MNINGFKIERLLEIDFKKINFNQINQLLLESKSSKNESKEEKEISAIAKNFYKDELSYFQKIMSGLYDLHDTIFSSYFFLKENEIKNSSDSQEVKFNGIKLNANELQKENEEFIKQYNNTSNQEEVFNKIKKFYEETNFDKILENFKNDFKSFYLFDYVSGVENENKKRINYKVLTTEVADEIIRDFNRIKIIISDKESVHSLANDDLNILFEIYKRREKYVNIIKYFISLQEIYGIKSKVKAKGININVKEKVDEYLRRVHANKETFTEKDLLDTPMSSLPGTFYRAPFANNLFDLIKNKKTLNYIHKEISKLKYINTIYLKYNFKPFFQKGEMTELKSSEKFNRGYKKKETKTVGGKQRTSFTEMTDEDIKTVYGEEKGQEIIDKITKAVENTDHGRLHQFFNRELESVREKEREIRRNKNLTETRKDEEINELYQNFVNETKLDNEFIKFLKKQLRMNINFEYNNLGNFLAYNHEKNDVHFFKTGLSTFFDQKRDQREVVDPTRNFDPLSKITQRQLSNDALTKLTREILDVAQYNLIPIDISENLDEEILSKNNYFTSFEYFKNEISFLICNSNKIEVEKKTKNEEQQIKSQDNNNKNSNINFSNKSVEKERKESIEENDNNINEICSFLNSDVFKDILDKPLISKRDGENFITILNEILQDDNLTGTIRANEDDIKNIINKVKELIYNKENTYKKLIQVLESEDSQNEEERKRILSALLIIDRYTVNINDDSYLSDKAAKNLKFLIHDNGTPIPDNINNISDIIPNISKSSESELEDEENIDTSDMSSSSSYGFRFQITSTQRNKIFNNKKDLYSYLKRAETKTLILPDVSISKEITFYNNHIYEIFTPLFLLFFSDIYFDVFPSKTFDYDINTYSADNEIRSAKAYSNFTMNQNNNQKFEINYNQLKENIIRYYKAFFYQRFVSLEDKYDKKAHLKAFNLNMINYINTIFIKEKVEEKLKSLFNILNEVKRSVLSSQDQFAKEKLIYFFLNERIDKQTNKENDFEKEIYNYLKDNSKEAIKKFNAKKTNEIIKSFLNIRNNLISHDIIESIASENTQSSDFSLFVLFKRNLNELIKLYIKNNGLYSFLQQDEKKEQITKRKKEVENEKINISATDTVDFITKFGFIAKTLYPESKKSFNNSQRAQTFRHKIILALNSNKEEEKIKILNDFKIQYKKEDVNYEIKNLLKNITDINLFKQNKDINKENLLNLINTLFPEVFFNEPKDSNELVEQILSDDLKSEFFLIFENTIKFDESSEKENISLLFSFFDQFGINDQKNSESQKKIDINKFISALKEIKNFISEIKEEKDFQINDVTQLINVIYMYISKKIQEGEENIQKKLFNIKANSIGRGEVFFKIMLDIFNLNASKSIGKSGSIGKCDFIINSKKEIQQIEIKEIPNGANTFMDNILKFLSNINDQQKQELNKRLFYYFFIVTFFDLLYNISEQLNTKNIGLKTFANKKNVKAIIKDIITKKVYQPATQTKSLIKRSCEINQDKIQNAYLGLISFFKENIGEEQRKELKSKNIFVFKNEINKAKKPKTKIYNYFDLFNKFFNETNMILNFLLRPEDRNILRKSHLDFLNETLFNQNNDIFFNNIINKIETEKDEKLLQKNLLADLDSFFKDKINNELLNKIKIPKNNKMSTRIIIGENQDDNVDNHIIDDEEYENEEETDEKDVVGINNESIRDNYDYSLMIENPIFRFGYGSKKGYMILNGFKIIDIK